MARVTTQPYSLGRTAERGEPREESREHPPPAGEATLTEELVDRARGGDAAAWARLYQEHFDALFRDVGFLCGDATLAEDIVQEAFARALAGLHRFEGRASFATWLRGIAHNIVHKHWRSRTRKARAHARLKAAPRGDDDGGPEGAHLERTRGQVLLAVLDTLPSHLREAFVLRDLREVPVPEAAAQLGISPGNVKVRASRARARIRRELVKMGWITEEDP